MIGDKATESGENGVEDMNEPGTVAAVSVPAVFGLTTKAGNSRHQVKEKGKGRDMLKKNSSRTKIMTALGISEKDREKLVVGNQMEGYVGFPCVALIFRKKAVTSEQVLAQIR